MHLLSTYYIQLLKGTIQPSKGFPSRKVMSVKRYATGDMGRMCSRTTEKEEKRQAFIEHLLYAITWARHLRDIRAFNLHKLNFRN